MAAVVEYNAVDELGHIPAATEPASTALRAFVRSPFAMSGFVLLLAVMVIALTAGILYPGDPLDIVAAPLLWPGQDPQHILGTDALGRDVAAALVHGSRASLFVGLCSALIGVLIGTLIGAVGGYFGGVVDDILVRITELFQITPSVLLMMIFVIATGRPSAYFVSLAIGITAWPTVARLIRAQFRQLKEMDFVLAARGLGHGNARIIIREILPNALPPVIVTASVMVAAAILMSSSLAFLGLGDPNTASWGAMIGEGRQFLRTEWYLTALPGIALTVTVLALNIVGDGLNDALNPRSRSV